MREQKSRPSLVQRKIGSDAEVEPRRDRSQASLGHFDIGDVGVVVQRSPSSAPPPKAPEGEGVHRAAAEGLSGPSQPLPYLDKIQKSFGSHDVGAIKAHVGERASAGSRAMGAQAFASGDQVAFDGTPSLFVAAHEAAHVVQQRAGVHLKGGVGEAGDAFERNADEAAAAVVQGESAEPVLAPFAAKSGGGSGAVQRVLMLHGLQWVENGVPPLGVYCSPQGLWSLNGEAPWVFFDMLAANPHWWAPAMAAMPPAGLGAPQAIPPAAAAPPPAPEADDAAEGAPPRDRFIAALSQALRSGQTDSGMKHLAGSASEARTKMLRSKGKGELSALSSTGLEAIAEEVGGTLWDQLSGNHKKGMAQCLNGKSKDFDLVGKEQWVHCTPAPGWVFRLNKDDLEPTHIDRIRIEFISCKDGRLTAHWVPCAVPEEGEGKQASSRGDDEDGRGAEEDDGDVRRSARDEDRPDRDRGRDRDRRDRDRGRDRGRDRDRDRGR